MIESALKYIGPNSTNMCDVASKYELLETSPYEPLGRDTVDSFIKSLSQTEEMFRGIVCNKNMYICNR